MCMRANEATGRTESERSDKRCILGTRGAEEGERKRDRETVKARERKVGCDFHGGTGELL